MWQTYSHTVKMTGITAFSEWFDSLMCLTCNGSGLIYLHGNEIKPLKSVMYSNDAVLAPIPTPQICPDCLGRKLAPLPIGELLGYE